MARAIGPGATILSCAAMGSADDITPILNANPTAFFIPAPSPCYAKTARRRAHQWLSRSTVLHNSRYSLAGTRRRPLPSSAAWISSTRSRIHPNSCTSSLVGRLSNDGSRTMNARLSKDTGLENGSAKRYALLANLPRIPRAGGADTKAPSRISRLPAGTRRERPSTDGVRSRQFPIPSAAFPRGR